MRDALAHATIRPRTERENSPPMSAHELVPEPSHQPTVNPCVSASLR